MGPHETEPSDDSESGEEPISTGQAAAESNDPTGPEGHRKSGPDADVDLTSHGEDATNGVLLLDDHGVTAYRGGIGKPFDGKLQTVVDKFTTDNDRKHGTVKESKRPGFEQNERILVKERVAVFEFQALRMSGEPAAPDGAGQTDNKED